MRGTGVWADTIAAMFHSARTQAGIPSGHPELSISGFRKLTRQPGLFDASIRAGLQPSDSRSHRMGESKKT